MKNKQKRNTISPFWRLFWQFCLFSNSRFCQKMLSCFRCSCCANESDFDDLSNWEHIYCEVEVHLEYRIMYEHARRESCEKAACCFQFGRVWKMTNFICRSKIFSNMAAVWIIFFCCTHWIHISLHIKNFDHKSKIRQFQGPCDERYVEGIMVDSTQRCSLIIVNKWTRLVQNVPQGGIKPIFTDSF